MSYRTLLFLFTGLLTSPAFAAAPVFQGSLQRSSCWDHGGAFEQGTCRAEDVQQNRCTIRQQMNSDGSLFSLSIEIPGRTIRARFGSAYLYGPQGIAYTATVGRSTSLEVLTALKNGLVTKVNVYTDHEQTKKGNRITRTYTQYSCRNLRLVR
jgi:hypothetical protein